MLSVLQCIRWLMLIWICSRSISVRQFRPTHTDRRIYEPAERRTEQMNVMFVVHTYRGPLTLCVISWCQSALWKIPVNLRMVRICLRFNLRASYCRRVTAKFHAVFEIRNPKLQGHDGKNRRNYSRRSYLLDQYVILRNLLNQLFACWVPLGALGFSPPFSISCTKVFIEVLLKIDFLCYVIRLVVM
jgi:hypothetical protein